MICGMAVMAVAKLHKLCHSVCVVCLLHFDLDYQFIFIIILSCILYDLQSNLLFSNRLITFVSLVAIHDQPEKVGPKKYIFLTLSNSDWAAQISHRKRGKHRKYLCLYNGMETPLLH